LQSSEQVLFTPIQPTLQAAQFEESHLSSLLLSSDRPGIISVGVLLQQSQDKQHGTPHMYGRNFTDAYTTKTQIQSNTNTPTTIPTMYSTGKSFPASVAAEFGRDVISKYEASEGPLEFVLLSTKLTFVMLNGMTGSEVLTRQTGVIGSQQDTNIRKS
jgi:hypothetical protein